MLTSHVSIPDVPMPQQSAMKTALTEPVAKVINEMLKKAMVMPGITTSMVGMPPGTPGAPAGGVTTAPGKLTFFPATVQEIAKEVSQRTKPLGLDAGQAKVLDGMLVKALELAQEAMKDTMMLPGIPVVMTATAGPGKLSSPGVNTLSATLPEALRNMEPTAWIPPAPVMGRMGQLGPCLPKNLYQVIGKLVSQAAKSAIDQAMVLPGIPVSMGITAGQGRIG